MNTLETTARWVKYKLGLIDDSEFVVAFRPAYELLLRILYGRRGLVRALDGEEAVRLRPAHRYLRDHYEPALFHYLKRTIQPGDVVLEVGAGVGIFTILLARWVGPAGRIYAFEPASETRNALQSHLILNKVADRVSLIPAAISDASGYALFYQVGTSGKNTLSANHSGMPQADAIKVPVTTIDEFCQEHDIIPALIKIDIEGFEFHALRGAKQTLARHGPAVVAEFHPMNWPDIGMGPQDASNVVAELGYKATSLEGQPDPFLKYGHVALDPLPRVLLHN